MAENNPSDTEKKGAGTYQMLWDCKFCGTEKLLGVEHRHCPICAAPQDPAWRYFPKEEDMVEIGDHQYVGADKICPACSQPNSAASTYCQQCGADLATGETVKTFGERDLGTGIAAEDTRRDVVKADFDAEMARVKADEARSAAQRPVLLGLNRKQLTIGGVLAIVAVIIAGIVYAVTYRRDTTGTVVALNWERVIEIEAFKQVSGEGWDETVPADAYARSCRERERGTERVEVGSHEECKDVDQGDGSFRRDCRTVKDYDERPVYDDYCTYTVDRWVKDREVKAEGTTKNDPAPAWPQYTLASGSPYGEERTGEQREVYAVVIEHEGEQDACDYDQPKWETFDIGDAVEMEVGIRGNPICDTVKVVGGPSLPSR